VTLPNYIKDPNAIYDASFAIVRERAKLERVPPDLHDVVIRLIHSCGMPDIINDLGFSADVVSSATVALSGGKPIFADCQMVAAGITQKFLLWDNPVVVALNDPRTPALAQQLETTRSAAAVDLWRDEMDGAVLVFGNAPTALFRALEHVGMGARPAAILGFPVGFVGAAESKAALADFTPAIPFLTIHGTRGGSAMASAAVNALAILACGES